MDSVEKLITDNIDIWSSVVKAKTTVGRGSSKKIDLYGIKKLRELILELAVRGLLVLQDANDEPASILLKKIISEKAKLLKEGKIKKQKTLSLIGNDTKPFELPVNWVWTQLGQITEIAPRNNLDDDIEVGFVPMPMVSTSYKGDHEQEVKSWGEIKKGYTHFADGDIALAKITPCFENSKASVFKGLKNGFGAGTTELHVARPIQDTIDPLFVLLYLKAPMFLEKGKTKMTGSAGQKRVPSDFFSSNPMPFPPLAEQQRIVAKVDDLMALCDQLEQQTENSISAHQILVQALLSTLTNTSEREGFNQAWARIAEHFDTLFITEWSIDQLKQTILQLAVMGKLVPQNPKDEPASKLLQKIAAEKDKLIKEGRIKKQKTLPPILDDEKPYKLPQGWEVTRLDELLPEFQNGASSRGDSHGKEIVVIRLADISNWRVSLDEPRHLMIAESSITKYSLQKDDVLIIRVNGSANIVGRFVFCEKDLDAIYCDHFIRMRFPLTVFSPEYLSLLGSSKLVRSRIEDMFVSTAGQKTVNQKHIGSLVLTLPPLDEQKRIVVKVEELMVFCDTIKANINTAKITQLRLADAVSEQAIG